MSKNENDERAPSTTSRRELIKKTAVGAAAAGVVWSAPKVEGLSLRPSYAAAGSGVGPTTAGATVIFEDTLGTFDASGATSAFGLGGGSARVRGKRFLANIDLLNLDSFNYNGSGTAEITGINGANIVAPGNIDPPAPLNSTFQLQVANNSVDRHFVRVNFRCT